MLSRNRSKTPAPDATPSTAPAEVEEGKPVGKGRPTPKRKAVEQAKRRPLGAQDRKSAVKEARAKAKEQRDREYQAMLNNDERYLPARDKGPVKRWIRDYIDARRNIGEYFLPVSIVMVFATLLANASPELYFIVIGLLYLVVFVTIIDAFFLSRRLRKRLHEKFGEEKVPRGSIMYGVLRAFQIRRTRLPKPRVARGQHPA